MPNLDDLEFLKLYESKAQNRGEYLTLVADNRKRSLAWSLNLKLKYFSQLTGASEKHEENEKKKEVIIVEIFYMIHRFARRFF